MSLFFVGILQRPLVGWAGVPFVIEGVIDGADNILEHVVDSLVVHIVWCGVSHLTGRIFEPPF